MSRLTKRIHNSDGENIVVYTAGKFTDTTAAEMTSSDVRNVLRVLANYEDAEENNDQQVRHGGWKGYTTSAYIGSENEYGDPRYADRRFYRCSECRYGSVVRSKFCPNCGAKMDKE